MAPFVRLDNMEYDEIVQCMQELIYNLNVPRAGQPVPLHEPDLRLDVPG